MVPGTDHTVDSCPTDIFLTGSTGYVFSLDGLVTISGNLLSTATVTTTGIAREKLSHAAPFIDDTKPTGVMDFVYHGMWCVLPHNQFNSSVYSESIPHPPQSPHAPSGPPPEGPGSKPDPLHLGHLGGFGLGMGSLHQLDVDIWFMAYLRDPCQD